jgi:excisionase family DNA binding protein
MEFYTKDEVAKYLRVHPRTIERWLMSGSLKGYKLGKEKTSIWRIDKKEVEKFLEKHKNKK